MKLWRRLLVVCLAVVMFSVALVGAPAVSEQGSVAAAQAASIETDLLFLVDGSGSIDANDWEIQKEGIGAALQDEALFPLDGTIAVTVIQWSSSVEVEVARAILATEAARDAAVAAIDAMIQNGGGTSPHLGIDAAVTELAALPDAGASQVLCMSTDGTPSSAPALSTSAANAEAAGVTRYSVVAIEDLPFFDETIAQSSYGPVVFGGGSVTTSRNAAEFATVVGGACLGDAVDVVAIEVNQAIQDWNGSITLVEDKPTVVRVFVEPQAGESSARAVARLRAFRGTTELGAPLLPVNNSVEAMPDAASRRGDINSSLNFILDPAWLFGDVRLEVELIPGTGACREAVLPANTCTAEVSFQEVDLPRIRIVGVAYDDLAGNEVDVTNAELTEQGLRLQSAFPAPRVEFEGRRYNNDYEEVEVTEDDGTITVARPDLGIVIADLLTARSGDSSDDIYYGVLDGSGGGLGYRPGNASAGYLSGSGGTLAGSSGTSYARNRGVHEVMHNLAQTHSGDGAGNGYCGADVSATAAAHPYVAEDYADDGNDGVLDDYALLGPLVGAIDDSEVEDEIWGVDVRYVGVDDTLAVVNPNNHTAVMSYCDPLAAGQGRWVDGFTYLNLIDEIDDRFGRDPRDINEDIQTLISGWVDFASGDVEFRPVIEATPAIDPQAMPAGNYELTMLDSAGALVSTTPFDPFEIEGDDPESGEPRGLFHIGVEGGPFSAAIVTQDGVEIGRVDASPSAPEVVVDSPLAGASLGTDGVTVQWSATDLDGDDLFTTIFYSPDGGATWTTVALHIEGNSTTLAPGLLTESNNGTLQVVVTDGLNVTVTEVENLVVPNSPPMVTLIRPAAGALFSGVQTVLLEAIASDPDEGNLPDSQIAWSSDLDGPLGTGGLLPIVASDLSEGIHVITVVATDAFGATASAQVSIEITRVPRPPTPTDPCVVAVPTIEGTEGDDDIKGTTGDDVIFALGGDDKIDGKGGNDLICAGDGDDDIKTADGDDYIDGGSGDDTIDAKAGDNIIRAGDGNNNIKSGNGADDIVAGDGDDKIDAKAGDNVIDAGDGNNDVKTHEGNDLITTGNGDDKIDAKAGDNVIDAGDGNNDVKTHGDNDLITTGNGDDKIDAKAGDNVIDAGDGNNDVKTQGGNDLITTGNGDDKIDAKGGDDVIDAGGGNDVVDGGGGLDSCFNAEVAKDCEVT